MKAALDLLAELHRSDGHLKQHVVENRVSLYNGMGGAQLSQPVPEGTFKYLLDNGWIVRTEGRETRVFRISDAGKAQL
jgi:hypothetical protein